MVAAYLVDPILKHAWFQTLQFLTFSLSHTIGSNSWNRKCSAFLGSYL